MIDLWVDPLFRLPFITGLSLAVALSVVGAFLRMRNEWLAALALSQVAAAGGMAAAVLHAPVTVGAFAAAGLAVCLRSALPRVGNSHHAMLILLGWSATLILGAQVHHGQVIGETFLRGQLYFTHKGHLIGAVCLLSGVLVSYRWLSPRLLTARFFPDYHHANRMRVWPYRTLFAVLTMSAAVLGTMAMGAFPAFAMLFVPPWIGFVLVDGWFRSVVATVVIACSAYVAAFALAMWVDWPFGPVLAGLLVLLSPLRLLTSLRRRGAEYAGDDVQFNYLAPAWKDSDQEGG